MVEFRRGRSSGKKKIDVDIGDGRAFIQADLKQTWNAIKSIYEDDIQPFSEAGIP